mmetsp:Transcript_95096/g.198806  ORF Transcript_95096/g.198806 Transcript_95096/m.198806 type:complete len:225 (-) Transcript_95096:46-720(-)
MQGRDRHKASLRTGCCGFGNMFRIWLTTALLWNFEGLECLPKSRRAQDKVPCPCIPAWKELGRKMAVTALHLPVAKRWTMMMRARAMLATVATAATAAMAAMAAAAVPISSPAWAGRLLAAVRPVQEAVKRAGHRTCPSQLQSSMTSTISTSRKKLMVSAPACHPSFQGSVRQVAVHMPQSPARQLLPMRRLTRRRMGCEPHQDDEGSMCSLLQCGSKAIPASN